MSFYDDDHDERTQELHERRVRRCRATECNAKIIWLTLKGRAHPVDADTVEIGDEVFDADRHVSHFATCPAADKFRKARR